MPQQNPIAQKLSEASVVLEGTSLPEISEMLRIGANEIQRLQCRAEIANKVEWVLNDSVYKAPEMHAEMWADRWRPMLMAALKAAKTPL